MNDKPFDFKVSKPASPVKAEPDQARNEKKLPQAAIDALAEAAERRAAREAEAAKAGPRPVEHNGPSGKEPTRYGDWERGGIAYDF